MNVCPTCASPQMLNHPAGVLAIKHAAQCPLLTFEDGTAVADNESLSELNGWWTATSYVRPATAAELVLLAAVGFVPAPQQDTTVTGITPGVRNRSWPGTRLASATESGTA